MAQKSKPVIFENVRLALRNFSGGPLPWDKSNTKRSFALVLDEDIAQAMKLDGWNIKYFKPNPNDPDDEPQAWLQVFVRFDNFPPRIEMITSRGKTRLSEDTVSLLDFAIITNCDLTISPYEWSVNGKSGKKAYLKTLYATIEENELDRKYADIPDVGPVQPAEDWDED